MNKELDRPWFIGACISLIGIGIFTNSLTGNKIYFLGVLIATTGASISVYRNYFIKPNFKSLLFPSVFLICLFLIKLEKSGRLAISILLGVLFGIIINLLINRYYKK